MRILHVVATLDPKAGGPSNSIRRIIAAYPAIGSEGEVLTLDDPDAPFLRDVGFTVHGLGPVSTKFGYTGRLIPWLRANRGRLDGVVVHGLWQYTGLAVRLVIYPHKPYLVFTHGMLDPYFKRASPLKHLKKIPYWLLIESLNLRNATRVLFTSDIEASDARKSFWPSRWEQSVVPYGATAPSGDPAVLRKVFLDAHQDLRNDDGTARRYILFLGRIHTKKGCDLLLEAFARLADTLPDLHLVFAGPDKVGTGTDDAPASGTDSLKDKLVKRADTCGIGHRVHWTGMLYGDQKWGAFYGCDVFALPSHQENFGIAVAEALACGKPVLISDKVNIWKEIVDDGAAFVAADTVDGTLRTLRDWFALTPARKITMESNALDCFRRRYDMKANAAGIVDIFAQILTRPEIVPADLAERDASAQ